VTNPRRDPTRSGSLRRTGRVAVARRVFELHKRLRLVLQEHDVVGLRTRDVVPENFLTYVEGDAGKLERSEFMLRRIVEETLATPPDWLRALIERSVWKGVQQVGQELREAIADVDPGEVSDFHAVAAGNEVKGIAGETERRVLRNVARALEVRQSPEELMREVRRELQHTTKQRLILLVNLAVVRAVNAGKLFGYKAKGVRKVGIEPEWLPPKHRRLHDHGVFHDRDTRKAKVRKRKKANAARRVASRVERQREKAAQRSRAIREQEVQPMLVNVLTAGDDKVCQDCQDIAAEGPYTLDDAGELIPAHPNCRCAFVPWGDLRFAGIEEQEEELEE